VTGRRRALRRRARRHPALAFAAGIVATTLILILGLDSIAFLSHAAFGAVAIAAASGAAGWYARGIRRPARATIRGAARPASPGPQEQHLRTQLDETTWRLAQAQAELAQARIDTREIATAASRSRMRAELAATAGPPIPTEADLRAQLARDADRVSTRIPPPTG
jgi:hypothetical protein